MNNLTESLNWVFVWWKGGGRNSENLETPPTMPKNLSSSFPRGEKACNYYNLEIANN